MVDSKQIEAYCEKQGWICSATHGKKNGKRTIYPMVWRTENDRHMSNWWTIVIYRDEIDHSEMTKIMDKAFETIMSEWVEQ